MAHREIGADLLKRIETDLEELAIVEQFPKWKAAKWLWSWLRKRK
jgi:hypothetical protein